MATETMISWRGGKMWVAEFMKHIEINITWDFNDLVTLLNEIKDAEQRTEYVVATITRHILG